MQTTIRCSEKERDLINKTARVNDLFTNHFLIKCLDEFLPLAEQPVLNKTIIRTNVKIGLEISEELKSKITENIDELSTKYRKVKMWEIILYCGLKGCESK